MKRDIDSSGSVAYGGGIGGRVIFLALVLATAGYFLHRSNSVAKSKADQNSDEHRPVAVAVAPTWKSNMPIYLNGLGTMTPLRTVTVHSRVDGELVRVAFDEGQTVKRGDLLADIDSRAFQVQLQQALGQLQHDEALLKNAEIDLARYKTLLAQDSIAAQQTATQEALVKQYRGTVEVDRSQVKNAQLQLSYCRITAPINGRVGLRLVDQGNLVRASDSNGLVVITQLQPITAVFSLPEDSVQKVLKRWHAGDILAVEAYDREGLGKLADGKLLALDNQIDPTTGTYKLKAEFDNKDRHLFPNQFVNIKMHLDTLRDVVLAPAAAIQQGVDGSFVYVVKDDGTAGVAPVKLGPGEGDTVAVLEGLGPQQKVVVDGADKLREGQPVKIIGSDKAETTHESSGKAHGPS